MLASALPGTLSDGCPEAYHFPAGVEHDGRPQDARRVEPGARQVPGWRMHTTPSISIPLCTCSMCHWATCSCKAALANGTS